MRRASGRLDDTMYGPPVKHFVSKPGIHVTPESDYNAFDVNSTDGGKVWTCFTTGTGTPLASKYVPSNCRS